MTEKVSTEPTLASQFLARALEAETQLSCARARNEGLVDHLRRTLRENATLREQIALVTYQTDRVWFWQGDGNDHLGSLSCPVVMEVGTLQGIIAQIPAQESEDDSDV